MSSILIKNGRIIDASQAVDQIGNVRIEDDKIVSIDAADEPADTVIDATGKIVSPGLVDLHAQLREPGWEEDETVQSGTAAAVAGGFTTIACTPDTDPPIDTPAAVQFIQQRARHADNCNVVVIACASKGRAGEELSEIGALVEAGAVAFGDISNPISNPELLRRALEYTQMFDKPVLNRPEMIQLSRDGVMHDGLTSLILGLAPIPAEAEDVMAARDIRLCEATGGRLHLTSISCSGTVEILRRAKLRDVKVTAGICPQNFSLTDETLRSFDSNCKVNPPLRSADHIEACVAGLKDGTIDVISSGHAPRASEKKMRELTHAPFGVISLETLLGVVGTYLVSPGKLDWAEVLPKMTINPANILGIKKGTLAAGADADVTIIDPDAKWIVYPNQMQSHSSNTLFSGQTLQAKAAHVIVGGKVKF
ncbi:MAG: dihydroorotase [Pirellulales bacterium]